MKTVLRCAGALALSALIGFVLLAAVYCIPGEWMRGHLAESAAVFAWEGDYPDVNPAHPRVTRLDNVSDAIMLSIAGYDGAENPIEKVLGSYRWATESESAGEAFVQVYTPESAGTALSPLRIGYSRYWHGYAVCLRPLLVFLNYAQIRTLNAFALCAEFILCLMLMPARRRMAFALPFLTAAAMIAPQAAVQSLHFSSALHVTLLATLLQFLWGKTPRSRQWHCFFFLGVGVATGYLDLLTAPIITLVVPLVTLLGLESGRADGRIRLWDVLCMILAWGFGYAGIWAAKWMLAFLFEGGAFITQNLMPTIGLRVNSLNNSLTPRIETIFLRLGQCLEMPLNKMLVFAQAVLFGALALRTAVRRRFRDAAWHLLFVLAALIPFGWTFVMCNHSYVHFFTYRTFAPVFYAVLAALGTYAAKDETLFASD